MLNDPQTRVFCIIRAVGGQRPGCDLQNQHQPGSLLAGRAGQDAAVPAAAVGLFRCVCPDSSTARKEITQQQ